jgi:hypothetical protein
MRKRSVSSIFVNLKPIPRPVWLCFTTASLTIFPSGTKKYTSAVAPKGLGIAHSTNRPPGLMFCTVETISRPLQRQMIQTPSDISIRDSERLDALATAFNIRTLPEQSFGPRTASELDPSEEVHSHVVPFRSGDLFPHQIRRKKGGKTVMRGDISDWGSAFNRSMQYDRT